MSDGVKSFLSVSLRIDPEKRYSCGELFLHKWVQEQNEEGPNILSFLQTAAVKIQAIYFDL